MVKKTEKSLRPNISERVRESDAGKARKNRFMSLVGGAPESVASPRVCRACSAPPPWNSRNARGPAPAAPECPRDFPIFAPPSALFAPFFGSRGPRWPRGVARTVHEKNQSIITVRKSAIIVPAFARPRARSPLLFVYPFDCAARVSHVVKIALICGVLFRHSFTLTSVPWFLCGCGFWGTLGKRALSAAIFFCWEYWARERNERISMFCGGQWFWIRSRDNLRQKWACERLIDSGIFGLLG